MHFSKVFKDIKEFHDKFDIKPVSQGGSVDYKLRLARLHEELDEIEAGLKVLRNDPQGEELTAALAELLDGLVDTVYIAVGTMYLYDNINLASDTYEYVVNPVGVCSWPNSIPVNKMRGLVADDKTDNVNNCSQIVNTVFVYCAENNWPFDAAWDAVHAANMAKERAKPDASNSKHKSAQDIIKPDGWSAPNINKVIEEAKQ